MELFSESCFMLEAALLLLLLLALGVVLVAFVVPPLVPRPAAAAFAGGDAPVAGVLDGSACVTVGGGKLGGVRLWKGRAL